ncbi:MAG: hypothetical protein ACJ8DZ_13795 [Allosphingosinicella sp.]
MTATNMQLEDVLTILGRVGTVTLRKGTDDVSASPGHKADTEGWKCKIIVAGYLVPWGHGGRGGHQLTLEGEVPSEVSRPRGLSALEAAKRTLDELAAFLESDRARLYRERYLADGDKRDGVKPEAKIVWGDVA